MIGLPPHGDTTGNIREDLGVTEERCKVLCNILDKIVEDHIEIPIVKALHIASKQAETLEEDVFLGIVAGRMIERQMGAVDMLLKKILSDVIGGRLKHMARNN